MKKVIYTIAVSGFPSPEEIAGMINATPEEIAIAEKHIAMHLGRTHFKKAEEITVKYEMLDVEDDKQ